MKTSLGIWAFGPMVTRFVPGGYQPSHDYETEPVADKVHRAVEGLGDLIDGYEFHYPDELSPSNLDEVRAALGPDHDIYCIAGGLHLDPQFGRGGLVNPDPALRAEAVSIVRDAAAFAGSLGAHLIIWPGGEGYNYPFQTPYADSWRVADRGHGGGGVGVPGSRRQAVPRAQELRAGDEDPDAQHRHVPVRDVASCASAGLDNVQVNMDWQHLIMNGEHLPEYAALLASEGLLGHQHANSGWGTFDDDNMVGATAFMETLELALEFRRCGYGSSGERLGFDLYPYTEDQVGAVRRSVLQWQFIDSVAARIDDAALREAQAAKDAVRAYEIVYAALGA